MTHPACEKTIFENHTHFFWIVVLLLSNNHQRCLTITFCCWNQATNNMERHHQQANSQAIGHVQGNGIYNYRETVDDKNNVSSMEVDVSPSTPLPPPSTRSKSKTEIPFAIYTPTKDFKQMLIAAPESTHSAATKDVRRSNRIPKLPVMKKGQSIKHTLHDQRSRPNNKTTPIASTMLRSDASVLTDVSPMCVKKKMRCRTLMQRKKVPHEMRSNPNCNKKLPMMTPTKSKTLVTKLSFDTGKDTTTNTATKDNVDQTKTGNSLSEDVTMLSVAVQVSAQIVRSSPTKRESAIHYTKSANLESRNHVNDHGMNVVHGVNALLNDETALFEESADFWDGFLLDTYRQITSNNPDSYDFEPIPYDVLARGAPVEVETDSYPKHQSVGVDSSQASMMTDNAAAKPTASKVDVTAIAQNAQDQHDQRGVWHAKDYDVRVKKTNNLDVTYAEMCSKDPTKFVGPNAWQMDVIHRMIFFLDHGSQEQYSLYSQHFHTITQECTTHHMNGSLKHRHLPGAIFEQLVDAIGGSTFLSIYKEAKQISFGRLQSGHAVIVDEAVPIEPPSLIQLAVGYGYSLAMAHSGNGPQLSDDVTQNESESAQRAKEIGAQALIEMSSESRLSFWNDRIMNHDDMSD
jgi:hypothetical protein